MITRSLPSLPTLFLCVLFFLGILKSVNIAIAQSTPVKELIDSIPLDAAAHNSQTSARIQSLVPEVENWVVEQGGFDQDASNSDLLAAIENILTIDRELNEVLGRLYQQRIEFIDIENAEHRYLAARNFLGCATALIKLSGKVRYYTVDLFSGVGYDLEQIPEDYEALIDLYLASGHSVGAMTSLSSLLESLRDPTAVQFSDHLKGKILQLARAARDVRLLPSLAEISRQNNLPPELLIFVVDTIRHIGLPQDPRSDSVATLSPPVITAKELLTRLYTVDDRNLSDVDNKRKEDLLVWLKQRDETGVQGEYFRFGSAVVHAGDWILMKNPSPYNRFTDLQPGLFTHAGIITTEAGKDGRRRFVVVDLPEVGNTIPATTVDKFVERTLDYVIIRHQDTDALATMGRVANSIIGNDSKFDLNFETSGIKKLKGENLDGKLIEGYCAGLLLLCAQETGKPLQEFFPLEEHPARGNTLSNLAQLDVSMPNQFLSPTGPLFSPSAKIVYRCHTMYSPRRQIEQTVYDHFAEQMRNGRLIPSLNWYEALRLNLAQAAETTPALKRALANAAGVNQNINLVAAAKLGAVVQSLDDIARASSSEYQNVRNAFRLDVIEELDNSPEGDREFEQVVRCRREHADLFVRWEAGAITPRELRTELVDYYIQRGCRQLDDRFFQTKETAKNSTSTPQPSP